MLDELVIDNLGLIESVQLSLQPGLVAVSGETGAGKTMFVGALRLLVGDKARRDAIGPAGESASVEGRFLLDSEVVARRVVTNGRSRAYLDGAMATNDQLANTVGPAVEIVTQHDQLSLKSPHFVRTLIDSMLDTAGVAALESYRAAFHDWKEVRRRAEALGGDRRTLERELEMAQHEASEIAGAGLAPETEVELIEVASRLRHLEELLERFDQARHDMETARDAVGRTLNGLRRAAQLDPSVAETVTLMDGAAAELAEADHQIMRHAGELPHDPAELPGIERRLATIGDLKRKYGDSVSDVLSYGKAAAARADELRALLESADAISGQLAEATQRLTSSSVELTVARQSAAERLCSVALAHLRDMGMAAPVVAVEAAEVTPGPDGAHRYEVLFSSDERLAPGPVSRIASGGELSRLTLALRLSSRSSDRSILVFDEVDAGVGGETGLAVGRKLASLAAGSQVLCVTHLPQVAAFADQHLVVDRVGTTSVVREVTESEREVELARMLSGMSDSSEARRHARELLAAGREQSE